MDNQSDLSPPTIKVVSECIVSMCSFGANPIAFQFWTTISLSLDLFVIVSLIFCTLSLSRDSIRFGLSMLGNLTIIVILKYTFGWQRLYPECGGRDPSMPSGHTATVFFTASYLYILWCQKHSTSKRLRNYRTTVVYVWSALVGIARIYLGYHREVEVLAGFILGNSLAYGAHRFWALPQMADIQNTLFTKHQKPYYIDERNYPLPV